MKKYFAPGLILAYLLYLGFVPVTVAHSIILVSLVGLYGFQEFLTRPEKINYEQLLAQLKESLEKQLAQNKEEVNAKFTAVEGEVQKISLQIIKASSSSSTFKKPDDKKIIF